jgi:hypothetical protein
MIQNQFPLPMKFLWHIRVVAKNFPSTTYRIFHLENNSYLADPLDWETSTMQLTKLYLEKTDGTWKATSEEAMNHSQEIINKLCRRIETYNASMQRTIL